MTDEEVLLQLQLDLLELINTKYKDTPIQWLLIAATPAVTMFFGNCCAVCARNDLDLFIKANGLVHLEAQRNETMN